MSIVSLNINFNYIKNDYQQGRQNIEAQKIDGVIFVGPKTIPMNTIRRLDEWLFGKLDYFLYLNLPDNIELFRIEDEKGQPILDINGHNQSITKKECKMLKKAKKTYIVDSVGQRYETPCNFLSISTIFGYQL